MSPCSHNAATDPMMARIQCGTDGVLDRVLHLNQKQNSVPAIFIHAGAGFHSRQNETVHLKACVSAAEMGMRFLKAGATSTEAVEAALRILEDKEITNAGYGSNLSMDGTVECDATIVDHLGRSGACGAVPTYPRYQQLAPESSPCAPQALVGEGARAFAEEHGMATFANDYLVSTNSRDRFYRWQEDLLRAEGGGKDVGLGPHLAPSKAATCIPCQYETAPTLDPLKPFPRQHAAAILTGTWNEGQTDSPYAGTPVLESTESAMIPAHVTTTPMMTFAAAARSSLHLPTSQRSPAPSSSAGKDKAQGTKSLASEVKKMLEADEKRKQVHSTTPSSPTAIGRFDAGEAKSFGTHIDANASRRFKRPAEPTTPDGALRGPSPKRVSCWEMDEGDVVTDTIGAIAIDGRGLIAAGSSSGGIGMKHRGRLGPAAIVGVGTAVVPCAAEDEGGLTVAAVTSGTGEHMATTMASQKCAERMYQGTRRGPLGFDITDDDEDDIMESFIANDFMNHPGVKHCHASGAIGVMVVKKHRTGYYLYFAHNTDSFALASMGGLDKKPHCTMSRLPEGSKIAKGGRKIRTTAA
ncbi:hypothetical protein L249_6095 [Ophiocordyceps polyrhachis-furcata BCC 54312]|uniref:Asparaginase n=1 Tax=Ophiocordyceps polyrhachis-furcata BCC 54312 TaxID=1330021 RepID=A0A367LJP9_9HYPO|nr:hypothetical protein L249_6095 [Ophiocordyceps polyrhachis-furcata BCC 54312]